MASFPDFRILFPELSGRDLAARLRDAADQSRDFYVRLREQREKYRAKELALAAKAEATNLLIQSLQLKKACLDPEPRPKGRRKETLP